MERQKSFGSRNSGKGPRQLVTKKLSKYPDWYENKERMLSNIKRRNRKLNTFPSGSPVYS